MDLGLGGRGYLLTGASRGLGFATARALVDDGARVLVSSRSQPSVDAAVASLGGAPAAHGLAADLAAADLVITGEGRFDDQSLHGKVISALVGQAGGKPVLVLAGQVTLDPSALAGAGVAAAHSIVDHAGSVELAISDAANQLAGLAAGVAAELGNNGPTRYR